MPNLKDLAIRLGTGAIAGAVATWAMKQVTDLLEANQKKKNKVRQAFAEKKSAQEAVVDRFREDLGVKMSRKERRRAVTAVKWGLGILNGVAMAWTRRRMGASTSLARGAALGMLSFLVVDELLKPAIGVRRKAKSVPWQTHARGFAGHATYGLVNAGVRKAIASTIN